MIVNAHMTDGRTVFQFASRGDLRKAIQNEPDSEEPVIGWVRWNVADREWHMLRACHIRKHAIAFVVDAQGEAQSRGTLDTEVPAREEADRRRARYEKREVERWQAGQPVKAGDGAGA